MLNQGFVIQVIGAVVDIKFVDFVNPILNALTCMIDDRKVVLEVAQHLGENVDE